MSAEFLERLARLDRMASAAPQGLLDPRARLVRPVPLAGRATPASAARPAELAKPDRPDRRVILVQQEARARLALRD